MARGDRVELRGFGAFSVKNRPARVGRNPRTGEQVDVGEKYVPQFKAGEDALLLLDVSVWCSVPATSQRASQSPVCGPGPPARDHLTAR